MTALYLLRHAHAGDSSKWKGEDAVRPLSDRGEKQAERVAALLSSAEERPDLFITSPKVRALDTAKIVAKALKVPLVVDKRLVGPLDPGLVEDILLAAGPAQRPCIVGHDPDFSFLLQELTGSPGVMMRKGALARVDYEGRSLLHGRGVLRFLVPPEVLATR